VRPVGGGSVALVLLELRPHNLLRAHIVGAVTATIGGGVSPRAAGADLVNC
jgi:hypothetical protein